MVRISTLFIALFVAPGTLWAEEKAQDKLYRPELQDKVIESSLRTDWYGLYLKGTKIGYFKTARSRQGEHIVEAFAMTLKLVSFGQKAEMSIAQSIHFESKPPYRMMFGTFQQSDNGVGQKIRVVRNDKGFTHEVEAAGQKRSRQLDDFDYTLADVMASEVWVRGVPKVNEQIVVRDLDLHEGKKDQTRHKVLAIKNSLVAGVEVKYFEMESESRKDMLAVLSRTDADGHLLSGSFAIFELRQEPEAQAKNAQFSKDLFVLGMAKIDRKIGRTTELKELVIEVAGKDVDVFEAGPRQSIERGDGSIILKTGKAHGKEAKATAKDIEDNLMETSAYAIADPKVQALAKKAIGDAETAEEKVRRIVAFTHDFIQPNLTATLPNIQDLLQKKKGDCKSYALLTTNLCRAAGVPAREVSGLLYMGDDQKAFGGHAWNEVVIDGRWVPVDASLNQVEVDAGHLCFGSESRATRNLLNSLGKLSFKVVEVKTR